MTTLVAILAGALLFALAAFLKTTHERGCGTGGCGACGATCRLLEADDDAP
jgi:hypothetical protein